jgi:hypothetical protein
MSRHDIPGAVLGYHRMGDYFYFAILEEGVRFLGKTPEEKFLDEHSFAGLVTAVHEHHHLIQDMFQGYFWWQQWTRDHLIIFFIDSLKGLGKEIRFPLWRKPPQPPARFHREPDDTLWIPKSLAFELDQIQTFLHSPELTQRLLFAEMRDSPSLKRFISEDALNLTTVDLVECQAAILTELYISKLLVEQPAKFDARVVRRLADLFRVDRLDPAYSRPLRVLVYLMDTLDFKLRVRAGADPHPLYAQIKHGLLYVLLTFLLDYALHLPPFPLNILSKSTDAASIQDIYPPFRFINLAFLCVMEIVTNRNGFAEVLTNEPLYYARGSAALAKLINNMHNLVRSQSGTGPPPPETFFSMEQTTQKWAELLDGHPLKQLFPMLHEVQAQCILFRRDHPNYFLELDPLNFDSSVGLPRVFLCRRGLGSVPYLNDAAKFLDVDAEEVRQKGGDEQTIEFLKQAMQAHYEGFLSQDPDRQKLARFPATLVPFHFMEAWMAREMSFRFSTLILYGQNLRCPMTESVGCYIHCRPRTRACESISEPKSMPVRDCLFRETVSQFFGGCEIYQRKRN